MPKTAPAEYVATPDGQYVILRKIGGQHVRYKKYQYQPLSSTRSIRLLKRIRAYQGDTSFDHFSIEERSLDDPTLSYVAISYVWGDSTSGAPLIIGNEIDDSVCLVTKSAWQAIEAICIFDKLVWIDQVSINQADEDERKEQIPLMGEIYTGPRRWDTVVWLGAADKETQMAFDLVEQLSKIMPVTKDIPIGMHAAFHMLHDMIRTEIQAKDPSYSPPADDDPSWTALGKLLAQTWYTRMWIFQEVVLTQLDSVSIVCASQERRYMTNLEKIDTGLDAIRASLHMINTTQNGLHNNEPKPLHPLLQITADRECKDPKDKIYALLNLQRNVLPMETINVEPNKSAAEVYVDTTRKIIKSESSILVGLSASGRIGGNIQQLPSWVPDYSTAILALYMEAMNPDSPIFSASRGRRWKDLSNWSRPALSWGQLPVQGRSIDTVDTIDDNVMPAEASGDDIYAYLRRILPSILSQSLRSSNAGNTTEMMLRIARTVIVGGYGSFMSRLRAFSFMLNLPSASYRANAAMSTPQQPTDDLMMLRREYFEPWHSRAPGFMSESEREWNFGIVSQAVQCKGRRFAFLKHRGVSLVPLQTEKDDIVAILHGSSLPVVLRPVGTGGTFRLIGPCYVDGIMLGEAVNWAEDKADLFVLQ